jgi:hypothetical protein
LQNRGDSEVNRAAPLISIHQGLGLSVVTASEISGNSQAGGVSLMGLDLVANPSMVQYCIDTIMQYFFRVSTLALNSDGMYTTLPPVQLAACSLQCYAVTCRMRQHTLGATNCSVSPLTVLWCILRLCTLGESSSLYLPSTRLHY